MAGFQAWRCDNCGTLKGSANHWYLLTATPLALLVTAWSDTAPAEAKHCCGSGCLVALAARSLQGLTAPPPTDQAPAADVPLIEVRPARQPFCNLDGSPIQVQTFREKRKPGPKPKPRPKPEDRRESAGRPPSQRDKAIEALRLNGPLTTAEIADRLYGDEQNRTVRTQRAFAVMSPLRQDGIVERRDDATAGGIAKWFLIDPLEEK